MVIKYNNNNEKQKQTVGDKTQHMQTMTILDNNTQVIIVSARNARVNDRGKSRNN